MKFSLSWAQNYSSVDFSKINIDQLVDKIGLQLGAVDEVVKYNERYQNALVVKILKCQPHPSADNLKLCWIDDGKKAENIERSEDGTVQIVCGGPNARSDMFAVWLPPGSIVPASWGNKTIKLETKDIRGQASNGMLASPAELGISSEQGGILEVKADEVGRQPKAGDSLVEYYGLNDTIIDIENKMFTHRPDCFGILGIARELAGITSQKFQSPDWYLNPPADAFEQKAFEALPLKAENKLPQKVSRFLAVALSDVKVAPSPYWLQAGLNRVGIKPINNVVDTLNFVMHLSGQPMHAFDYDKLLAKSGAGLQAASVKDGTELEVIGGKKLELSANDVVICGQDGQALALGGIIGGSETQVDDYSKNIVIECATFDMNSVRESSMRHGMFTDASTRYTKGQSPLQNYAVLAYCTDLLSQLSGAKVASQLIDIHQNLPPQQNIIVEPDFINSRLGSNITTEQVVSLLINVEFSVINESNQLKITPPFWRTDIKIEEDIVEEVGRLSGYQNLPFKLPKRDLVPAKPNDYMEFKNQLRRHLSKAGLNEVLTYSFVDAGLVESAGQDPVSAYHIRNAISPELQYYRLSLAPSLLQKIHPNIKLGYEQFGLFELGQVCLKKEINKDGVPVEFQRLAVVLNQKTATPPYFNAKNHLQLLTNTLGIYGLSYEPLENCTRTLSLGWQQLSLAYEPRRSAVVIAKGNIIGIIGEPNFKLKAKLKLPSNTSFFELDATEMLKLVGKSKYKPLNKYPISKQDVTFRMNKSLKYDEIEEFLSANLSNIVSEQGYEFKLTPSDIYKAEQEANHLNYSFAISFWHPQKTLKTAEINEVLGQLEKLSAEQLHAERL